MNYKLGSLFDGSGGFPLAGTMCGIEPVWAAEVEPYPIAVTRSRFPNMKHLGDVREINGAEIDPVDVVTFGSPCQDVSVAGRRAGLKHEVNGDEETTRSGLFMDAVRIIKEMWEATNGQYPSFVLWENVPGAFSSNKGEDFRVVLESLIKIVEPNAVMPQVPKAGWAYADCYSGDGWSLAYRVFDAQYWGVPQRRRRVYLVLDLRGQRAREVLFERESVRGYFAEGRTPWQDLAADARSGSASDGREGNCVSQYLFENHSQDTRYKGPLVISPMLPAQLGTGGNNTPFVVEHKPTVYESHPMDSRIRELGDVSPTCSYKWHKGAADTPLVCEPVYCLQDKSIGRAEKNDCNGMGYREGASFTITSVDRHAVAYALQSFGEYKESEVASGIKARDYKDATDLVCDTNPPVAFDRASFNQGQNAQYTPQFYEDGTAPTLVAKGSSGVCVDYIVRRLTPTECARLQGFPDRWGDIDPKDKLDRDEWLFWSDVRNTHNEINGKPLFAYIEATIHHWYNKLHTDSAEYKMWGNGIALPPTLYCMQGIADALNKEEVEEWML